MPDDARQPTSAPSPQPNANPATESERRFRRAFDDAPVGMALIDLQGARPGRIIEANAALSHITDREQWVLHGVNVLTIVHPSDRHHVASLLDAMSAGVDPPTQRPERRLLKLDGSDVWVSLGASAINDDDGRPRHAILHIEDISERKEFESQLAHQALHDPLTGLPNRAPAARPARAGAGPRPPPPARGSPCSSSTSTASRSSTTASATTSATACSSPWPSASGASLRARRHRRPLRRRRVRRRCARTCRSDEAVAVGRAGATRRGQRARS